MKSHRGHLRKHIVLGASLQTGLMLAGGGFSIQALAGGYQQADTAAPPGGLAVPALPAAKLQEGRCGEGKCGAAASAPTPTQRDGGQKKEAATERRDDRPAQTR